MNVFFSSGDLGDCIALLPSIRQLGGGKLVLGNWQGKGGRELMTKERFDAIAPLLRLQPYLTEVVNEDDPKDLTFNCHDFRVTPIRQGEDHTLVNWHADYFKLREVDISPWLTGITPSPETSGKSVFARTSRYHGQKFNWREIITLYPGALFVGFPQEYETFVAEFYCRDKVHYRPTSNLLEVAELIAGSDRLVANQSCHFWIACGMGHTLIQETDIFNLNSVIRRPNAEYRY